MKTGLSRLRTVEMVCEICGVKIMRSPHELYIHKHFYCSRQCVAKSQDKGIRLICKQCGIEYKSRPSTKERSKFCSQNCCDEYYSGKQTNCSYCGKEIIVGNWDITKYENHFCNRDCMFKYNTLHIIRTCKRCGKEFEVLTDKRMEKKYCSDECRNEMRKGRISRQPTGKLVTCEWCGKEKYRPACDINRHDHYFCNWNCRRRWLDQYKEYNPYPRGQWVDSLKEQVRTRDNRICQLCGKPETDFKYKLSVHHISCQKSNCDIDNLISLDAFCHSKTHHTPELLEVLKYETFIEDFINNPHSSSM